MMKIESLNWLIRLKTGKGLHYSLEECEYAYSLYLMGFKDEWHHLLSIAREELNIRKNNGS